MLQQWMICPVLIAAFCLSCPDVNSARADEPIGQGAAKDSDGEKDRLIARLIEMVKDKRADLVRRGNACNALAKLGDRAKRSLPDVVAFIEEQSKEALREKCCVDENANKALAEAMSKAISALDEFGARPQDLPLLERLVACNPDSATWAIGGVGTVEALRALSDISSKDFRREVRWAALHGLRRIAVRNDLPHAKDALLQLWVIYYTDPDPRVQDEASASIDFIRSNAK